KASIDIVSSIEAIVVRSTAAFAVSVVSYSVPFLFLLKGYLLMEVISIYTFTPKTAAIEIVKNVATIIIVRFFNG
ncbi:MAG: hypothetical protein J6T67_05510, partial [Paludibacteraceae bacterium]|nr:hypothetical protein [Paludibacteraceae bacterium]